MSFTILLYFVFNVLFVGPSPHCNNDFTITNYYKSITFKYENLLVQVDCYVLLLYKIKYLSDFKQH